MNDLERCGWRLVLDERREILAFFQGLAPEQWDAPSLCTGWRIRDVAAHLLVDEPVQAGMLRRVLPLVAKGRFAPNQVNAAWVAEARHRTPASIVETFRDDSRKRVGAVGHMLGAAVALRALVIHHQDMRRPLGIERVLPTDRMMVTLDALVAWKGNISIGSRSRARGLRLHAVDVGWSHGDGPAVVGPGEAIIMALAGRSVALNDLEGAGTTVLAARIC